MACASSPEQRRVLELKRSLARDGIERVDAGAGLAAMFKRNQDLLQAQRQLADLARDPDNEELTSVTVTGSRIASVSITNNQEAGVDEGGILKVSGNYLVVLRDGHLFVLSTLGPAGEELRVVDRLSFAELSGDGKEPIWFDELLATKSHLFVLGYDYESRRSDLRTFQLAADGRIVIGRRFAIQSQDYFSGDGYGARISGDRLLLQFSMSLSESGEQPRWPRWAAIEQGNPVWTPLVDLEQLYFPNFVIDEPTIHSFLSCDLGVLFAAGFDCETVAVVGNDTMQHYQTQNARYVALGHMDPAFLGDPDYADSGRPLDRNLEPPPPQTTLLRLPTRSSAVVGAKIIGSVRSGFDFHQSGDQLYVASDIRRSDSEVLLTEVANAAFSSSAPLVQPIARLNSVGYARRFGHNALWVAGKLGNSQPVIQVQPIDGSAAVVLTASMPTELLQPVGVQMIALGGDNQDPPGSGLDLYSSPPLARNIGQHRVPNSRLAESRSHGVNFAALPDQSTLFSWPVNVVGNDDWSDQPVDVQFIRIQGQQLIPLSAVSMGDGPPVVADEDNDWYGNTRVAYLGERIVILSGDLVKEVRYVDGQIREVRRADLVRRVSVRH